MTHSSIRSHISAHGHQPVNLKYLLLYLPAAVAWIGTFDPVLSFASAWIGSWWILWVSMTGRVQPLPSDRTWAQQLFRPLFLSQVMFFGLFCLGPVFYMWDLTATGGAQMAVGNEIQRTAAAQRYYVLGHAAFVHGILLLMDYRRSGEWTLGLQIPLPKLFLYGVGGFLAAMVLFGALPGVGQFVIKFRDLFVVSALLACAYAVRRGHLPLAIPSALLCGYILFEALLSGWKHQTILVVGLFLVLLYPKYKKTVIVGGSIIVIAFVTLLPAYNSVFRDLNWSGNVEAQEAAQEAFDRVVSGEINVEAASWSFLEGRLSTVSLFTDYIQSIPDRNPYYGVSMVQQAMYSVIPRVLWPSKPNTEEVVMQRVLENTYIRSSSSVSAKPLIVPDGYMAGGGVGVWVACFLLGCVASIASRLAERWFGGYEVGGQLVYTGLFARNLFTSSFEFLFNALLWSFVLMGVIAVGLWLAGVLLRESRSPSGRTLNAAVQT